LIFSPVSRIAHFCAYFVASSLFGYPRLSRAIRLLELVQRRIPGRITSSKDFAANTLVARIGIPVVVAAEHARERLFIVS
jgi:VanZ family protein